MILFQLFICGTACVAILIEYPPQTLSFEIEIFAFYPPDYVGQVLFNFD